MERKITLSKNLSYYRIKNGMSQQKLADKIGVSRQAITNWETSVNPPNIYDLSRLAEIFEVSLDDLVYGEFARSTADSVIDEKIKRYIDIALIKVLDDKNHANLLKQCSDYLDNQDDIPASALYSAAVDEAEQGNYTNAIALFEESLIRGEIMAVDSIITIYREIFDICLFEENVDEYEKYRLTYAKKIQEYGEIIETILLKRGEKDIED